MKWPVRELPGDIINSIWSQNKGKANGLFMDSLDVFIRLVKQDDADANKAIRLLFKRLYNGQIDKCMRSYLTTTYLFCLYKDEMDPTKLRPIGVPTAIRLIITNHIAQTFCRNFAQHSLAYKFSVRIDNGMDFVLDVSQLAVENIYHKKRREKNGQAPSRCFISLDLSNMFDEISRDKFIEIIEQKYPELLPLVSMLNGKDGTVFFKMMDGQ